VSVENSAVHTGNSLLSSLRPLGYVRQKVKP